MITFVPVVDISQSQGLVDMVKMKAQGVQGLILRVSHGTTLDTKYPVYYRDAIAAGFAPTDITHYTFINPKRGTGLGCAIATLDEIYRVVGHLNVGYMPDIENYRLQSPAIGTAPFYGPVFADWIREHIAEVHTDAPDAVVFGYSNLAYWNGHITPTDTTSPMWVGDDELAGELDWLAARYPAYSDAAYAHYGYPGVPSTWSDWAFNAQPAGPLSPRGGKWLGWQFAGGYDHQGPVYGATSRDLDLNIVTPAAWSRWTCRDPQPVVEDDMIDIVRDAETSLDKYGVMPDGTLRPLSGTELKARGIVNSLDLGAPLTQAERDLLGTYTAPAGVDLGARAAIATLGDTVATLGSENARQNAGLIKAGGG